MKKLLVLLAILLTIISYAEETEKKDWEVKPGIKEGGYSEAEGPYVYKLDQTVGSPSSLPYTHYDAYIHYEKSIQAGYGDFKIHAEEITAGQTFYQGLFEDQDGYYLYFHAERGWGWQTLPEGYSDPMPVPGNYNFYIYKKEYIQPLEVKFTAETYTAEIGQTMSVTVLIFGGSGSFSLSAGTRPAFLQPVAKGRWEGKSYDTLSSTISIVIKDLVTGQQEAATANIVITEKSEDPSDEPNNPNNPSNPSGPSDPSNPSNPSEPSEPAEPAEPTDPSNPDSPDSPTEPSDPDDPDDPDTPDNPDSPDEPEEPAEPEAPDTPSEPTDPSNPDSPDEPNDPSEPNSPDMPDSPDAPAEPDEPIVVPDPEVPDEPVMPDSPETPNDPDDTEPTDEPDDVIIIDPLEPGNEDNEPTIIVVDREASDNDKIIVTDDGVTTVHRDNHDLAIFLGMFGAMTGFTGSTSIPESAPVAVQEAREGKRHE